MNTYRSLTDALTAARNNYRGTADPIVMAVTINDDNYSVRFSENTNDGTTLNFQAGMMGFWGDSARQAYRNNQYAQNVVVGAVMLRSGGAML